MSDRDPIIDLLILLEAQASVALSRDPHMQTHVLDDRLEGDPTLGQIADDLLARIEPLIRADERERIAQAIESASGYPLIGDADWHTGVRYAARIARELESAKDLTTAQASRAIERLTAEFEEPEEGG